LVRSKQNISRSIPGLFSPDFSGESCATAPRSAGTLQGLASHGAAIGILFALWLYARKKKPGQGYFQVVDRIVILVALAGALIRLGNYFNSEIIGLPTEKSWGVVFVNRFTDAITSPRYDPNGVIESVEYQRNDSLPKGQNGRVPINIYIFFKRGTSPMQADDFSDRTARHILANTLYEYFDATGPNTVTNTVVGLYELAEAIPLGTMLTAPESVLAAPLVIYVSAPGFAAVPGKFQLTTELLRITFPYIFFIS